MPALDVAESSAKEWSFFLEGSEEGGHPSPAAASARLSIDRGIMGDCRYAGLCCDDGTLKARDALDHIARTQRADLTIPGLQAEDGGGIT